MSMNHGSVLRLLLLLRRRLNIEALLVAEPRLLDYLSPFNTYKAYLDTKYHSRYAR